VFFELVHTDDRARFGAVARAIAQREQYSSSIGWCGAAVSCATVREAGRGFFDAKTQTLNRGHGHDITESDAPMRDAGATPAPHWSRAAAVIYQPKVARRMRRIRQRNIGHCWDFLRRKALDAVVEKPGAPDDCWRRARFDDLRRDKPVEYG